MRIAIVSSRVGHDVCRHRRIATLLCHAANDAHRRGATWLIAKGSAIEPWAMKAAVRFKIPVQRLVEPSQHDDDGDVCYCRDDLNRDAAVIEMADRVEALYVRRGGKIASAIEDRLSRSRDASVRIAIWPGQKTAAESLIGDGAVGWFLSSESTLGFKDLSISGPVRTVAPPGDWLIHCTRGTTGPWSDETTDQYRDSMLSASDGGSNRTAIDALARILEMGRLNASAISSSHRHRVVCFSARRLDDLLAARTFRSHLSRWDYEPFGIMIRLAAAQSAGLREVIYGQPGDRSSVEQNEAYRFHPVGKTHDWTVEREWRSDGDVRLRDFADDDIRVFSLDRPESREKLHGSRYEVVWVGDGGVRESDVRYVIAASQTGLSVTAQ